MPQLQACRDATSRAAQGLDASLPVALSALLDEAIVALGQRSFAERIAMARVAAGPPPVRRSCAAARGR